MLSPQDLLSRPVAQAPIVSPKRTRAIQIVDRWDPKTDEHLDKHSELKEVHTTTPKDVPGLIWSSESHLVYLQDNILFTVPAEDFSSPAELLRFPEGVEASNIAVSGDHVYFSGQVWKQDGDFSKVKEHNDAYEKRKTSALVYESLPFRQWDSWVVPGKVWTMGKVSMTENKFINLLDSEMWTDSPYDFVVYSNCVIANRNYTSPGHWRSDMLCIDDKGIRNLTLEDDHGGLGSPVLSPDGGRIAWTQPMGHDGDTMENEVMIHDLVSGETTQWTSGQDWMPGSIFWSDSNHIYLTADHHGTTKLYWLKAPKQHVELDTAGLGSVSHVIPCKDRLFVTASSITHPPALYSIDLDGEANFRSQPRQITQWSPPLDLTTEAFWCKGADNVDFQTWIVKPKGYSKDRTWPMIMIAHGGPYGSTGDEWTRSWSMGLFASQGYVVSSINYTGSTGFGVKFMRRLHEHNVDRPQKDIFALFNAMQSKFSVDPKRTAFAGASYGGYLANWIQGHNPGFAAIVCHDGIFDLSSHCLTSDQGPGWAKDFGPFWTDMMLLDKANPRNFVQNFATPQLTIQGGKDFRCPEGQAIAPFMALQLRGVPSKLVYFPDENHGVSGNRNNIFWYETVFEWLDRWTGEANTVAKAVQAKESSFWRRWF